MIPPLLTALEDRLLKKLTAAQMERHHRTDRLEFELAAMLDAVNEERRRLLLFVERGCQRALLGGFGRRAGWCSRYGRSRSFVADQDDCGNRGTDHEHHRQQRPRPVDFDPPRRTLGRWRSEKEGIARRLLKVAPILPARVERVRPRDVASQQT